MKLESFRIKNCFGFQDSGEVTFEEGNLFYLLGRNSSGKSAFLNAIASFEYNQTPSEQPNFKNFDYQGKDELLLAKIFLGTKDFSLRHFETNFDKNIQGFREQLSKNEVYVRFKKSVLTEYQKFEDQLNSERVVVVEKTGNGDFRFLDKDGSKQSYNERKSAIEAHLKKNFNYQQENKQWLIQDSGSQLGLKVSFELFENKIFLLFPKIFLFDKSYPLNESLPDQIDLARLNSAEKPQFVKTFIQFLNEQTLRDLLQTENPDRRKELLSAVQDKINGLTSKINEWSGGGNLLEMTLDRMEGLQITVRTDRKISYYRHISDNTKFLFAYFLYAEVEKLEQAIILFDEPNSGFHPTAQEDILNFLKDLSSRNQVIVSTHSEYLIDPELLPSIKVMGQDQNKRLFVRNHIFQRATDRGDFLALQPLYDAIGLRYGSSKIRIKDRVIITEGITDLLYIRAFKNILQIGDELNIAPCRGDDTILHLIPLLISQGLAFKVIVDSGVKSTKHRIMEKFGIDSQFIFEVPLPAEFEGKTFDSGIEDVFSKKDFREKVLERTNHSIQRRPLREGFKQLLYNANGKSESDI